MTDNPNLGRNEIALLIGDITPDGVKYHLKKLITKGKIKRVGPDKGGFWQLLGAKQDKNK